MENFIFCAVFIQDRVTRLRKMNFSLCFILIQPVREITTPKVNNKDTKITSLGVDECFLSGFGQVFSH